MKHFLKSYDATPPGGFGFWQTKGIQKFFPADPLIENQAKLVAGFRQANGLPRATVKEALFDIGCYTCFRLNNDPTYCSPVADGHEVIALGQTSPIVAAPCAGCGAPVPL